MILEMVICFINRLCVVLMSCQLDEVIRLETERQTNRLWTPAQRLFHWHQLDLPDNQRDDEEEDPDTIQGLEPEVLDDLDMPSKRDPDALPPKNVFEWVMSHLYLLVAGIGGGNALYSVKAGVLTS